MINKLPTVSYILCVYNGEKTLRENLDSLLSQQSIGLELIIINDGSTDGSREILSEYAKKDKRIRLIHQPNLGLAAARNIGISMVTGDYIASAAHDDIYFPEKTIEQIEYMEKSCLDFSFAKVQAIDSKGSPITNHSMRNHNTNLIPWPLILLQVIIFGDVCPPSFLCKKTCYEKYKWNPGLLSHNDHSLFVKLFLHFRGGKIPKILLSKRAKTKEEYQTAYGMYTDNFIRIQHWMGVFVAIFRDIVPAKAIPTFHPILSIFKNLLILEIDPKNRDALFQLSNAYEKLGYKEAAKRLQYISEKI